MDNPTFCRESIGTSATWRSADSTARVAGSRLPLHSFRLPVQSSGSDGALMPTALEEPKTALRIAGHDGIVMTPQVSLIIDGHPGCAWRIRLQPGNGLAAPVKHSARSQRARCDS
jgi:hypothetical protein